MACLLELLLVLVALSVLTSCVVDLPLVLLAVLVELAVPSSLVELARLAEVHQAAEQEVARMAVFLLSLEPAESPARGSPPGDKDDNRHILATGAALFSRR